jgi:hypothetical protein
MTPTSGGYAFVARSLVPLESRIDFLSLHTGRKFQVPFDVMVVFATNLEPASLADEAFLRRIPYKILAKNPTYDQYCRIFELNCRRYGVTYDPTHVKYLHDKYYVPKNLQRRGCHPRDLIDQVIILCRYQKRPLGITHDLLDRVCNTYFIEEAQTGGTAASAR